MSIQEKSFGYHKLECLITGDPDIDSLFEVGFGIPLGELISIYGGPGCGKTNLALLLLTYIQKNGGHCFYVTKMGAPDIWTVSDKIDMSNTSLVGPETLEDAFKMIGIITDKSWSEGKPLVGIVWDDVSGTPTQWELTGEAGGDGDSFSEIVQKNLKHLVSKVSGTRTSLIFVSRLRRKIDVLFGKKDEMQGGKDLFINSAYVLKMNKYWFGNGLLKSKVKIEKNKFHSPFLEKTIEFEFRES